MDNNQMNGMPNNLNSAGGQNTVSMNNGTQQAIPQQMPMNNGTQQAIPQQMPMNNGMQQAMPQQMPMNNGIQQAMPQQMPMNNGTQQAMPQQMPMNNGMVQGGPNSPKKNNTALIVIIIVMSVVIVGLAVFIGVSLLSDNSSLENDKEVTETEKTEDEGNVGQVKSENIQTISYNGYNFKVDSGIVYKMQDGELFVRDSANTVIIEMVSSYGSYTQYLASSDKLKQDLINSGYGTIIYETQKYNNRDYMVFSGNYNNIPFQYFIVGLDSTHVLQGIIITKNGTEFDSGYNIVEDFVKDVNGTGTGDSTSSFSVGISENNKNTFFQQLK